MRDNYFEISRNNWLEKQEFTLRLSFFLCSTIQRKQCLSIPLDHQTVCVLHWSWVTAAQYIIKFTLAVSIVTAFLAPMTVAANGFILAAIWRNLSLRTPSYVLLAGLPFTDFCTGLLGQPFFTAAITASGAFVKIEKYCSPYVVSVCIGYYFSSLTVFVITMTAVERWLHMNRSSLLTVRRVAITYISFVVLLILLIPVGLYALYYREKAFEALLVFNNLSFCWEHFVVVTAFSYFKVFQIIRHHQNQIQTNESAIKMEKYKRSIFTIIYIIAIFVLSYIPYLCVVLGFHSASNYSSSTYRASYYAPC